METITIRDVKTILTAPEGIDLIIVKIETSEPGLYGLGCATFTQRALAVAETINCYMKPFLIGKDVQRIEDIWQSAMGQRLLAQRARAQQRLVRRRSSFMGY